MCIADLDLAGLGKLRDLFLGQPNARAVPDDLGIEVLIAFPHFTLRQRPRARIDRRSKRIALFLHRRQIGHLSRRNIPPRIRFVIECGDLLRAFGRASHSLFPVLRGNEVLDLVKLEEGFDLP
ncbi:MAG: hypothetical protein ABL931_00205 [Usitatibacteraceae bacterium]